MGGGGEEGECIDAEGGVKGEEVKCEEEEGESKVREGYGTHCNCHTVPLSKLVMQESRGRMSSQQEE